MALAWIYSGKQRATGQNCSRDKVWEAPVAVTRVAKEQQTIKFECCQGTAARPQGLQLLVQVFNLQLPIDHAGNCRRGSLQLPKAERAAGVSFYIWT